MIHAADVVINRLNEFKEKFSENENIPTDKVNERITAIDARVQSLEDLKVKIETASTLDELKTLGRDISNRWKTVKANNDVRKTQLLRGNVKAVFKRSEHLESRLDKVLADMEDQGIIVDFIDAKVDLFSAKIAEARALFKQSLEQFNEAKKIKTEDSSDDDRSSVAKLTKEAQSLAKDANKLLKEAHEMLKDIQKDIREAGGNADEVDELEEEVEIVEEEEEDDDEEEEVEDDE